MAGAQASSATSLPWAGVSSAHLTSGLLFSVHQIHLSISSISSSLDLGNFRFGRDSVFASKETEPEKGSTS